MAGAAGGPEPAAAGGELPRICTEDLARLLHADGPPSPTAGGAAAVAPVAGLSEQLKEKAAPVPLSPKKGALEPTKL